jgi:hypothetical protein
MRKTTWETLMRKTTWETLVQMTISLSFQMKKTTAVMMNLRRTNGQRKLETYGSKLSISPERGVQLIHAYSRTFDTPLFLLRLLQCLFRLVGHVEGRERSSSQKPAEQIYCHFPD